MAIPYTDKFEDLPAKVEFEVTKPKVFVLSFYTVTVKTDKTLAIRMKSNLAEMPDSIAVATPTKFAGLFNWAVTEFEKGKHMIWL